MGITFEENALGSVITNIVFAQASLLHCLYQCLANRSPLKGETAVCGSSIFCLR